MFALTKTYYGGSFVQIKKEMEEQYQVLYVIFTVTLCTILYMLDVGLGARFSILDATSAGLLVASALLRNERYNDYYYYRAFALILSIMLWVVGAIEYQNFELAVIALLYLSYLIFDVVTNVYQKATYENEYMQICEKYRKLEDEEKVKQKLKAYKKSK